MGPRIVEFSDFRFFLKEHFLFKKESVSGWSYGAWARHLGLANASVLSNIMTGKRTPGPQVMEKLMRYFRFSVEERLYFKMLVRLDGIPVDNKISELFDRMQKLARSKRQKIGFEDFNLIAQWHHYVLRELVSLEGFREDPSWIQKVLRFPLSQKKIETGFQNLLAVNLLERDPSGDLKLIPDWIETRSELANEALKRFHESMVRFALKSIRTIPVEKRYVGGTTFNIRSKDLPSIKQSVQDFHKALCTQYECSPGEETYQLNVQFFPLTKRVD